MKTTIIPNINIIGLTAFTSKLEIESCLNAGMLEVLFKPLKLNDFCELLTLLWLFLLNIYSIYNHRDANTSFNSYIFKGFDNTSLIPAIKQFLMSYWPVKAVKPIIGISGIIQSCINFLNSLVVAIPSFYGI